MPSDSVFRNLPLKLGLVGLGGYAAAMREVIERFQGQQPGLLNISAVCEPDTRTHQRQISEIKGRGIQVVADLDDLLATPVDAVYLPVPIHLHRCYSIRALQAGKAVLCEKPAAGCVEDVDAMIAARDREKRPAAIAFQNIYDPATRVLKTLLLDGRLGAVRHVTISGLASRGDVYFKRNAWAGSVQREGAWVLDSPLNNAMSHSVNLALFLLGPSMQESVTPQWVEAELYRARAIENYDTASLRIGLSTGASSLVLLSHACQSRQNPLILIEGDKGSIEIGAGGATMNIGSTCQHIQFGDARSHMIHRFCNLVAGAEDSRLIATLEVARAHTIVVNGASEASLVRGLPNGHVTEIDQQDDRVCAIEGIEAIFDRCSRARQMIFESGLAPWASAAGRIDLADYSRFAGLPS